ncbi:hypothetical protein [Catenuloplanes indicus]|uniref:Uncharacterized protein n=1 Tax=Catenuloplanes indicus TaxID=137267 RepID=A0AAE4AWL8_9ACTN|nr:hypothetical protein [Catenuloplanes indicus]MDQ0363348.1 hypothetical protein [Catenuloplanes indicus]MDQ0371670.1 hypothetical protein [Catenuloplanes indicus]
MSLVWTAWFSGVLTVMVATGPTSRRVYECHDGTWVRVTDDLHPTQSNTWEEHRIDPVPAASAVEVTLTALAAEEMAR